MPAVNGVGKPCAGKPHARFDAAGAGITTCLTRDTRGRTTDRETGGTKALGPTVSVQSLLQLPTRPHFSVRVRPAFGC